jgi:hypothetical protein
LEFAVKGVSVSSSRQGAHFRKKVFFCFRSFIFFLQLGQKSGCAMPQFKCKLSPMAETPTIQYHP